MAAPYWVTEAGDLGTIQEQEFYSLQLTGRDPEQGANNTGLTFMLIAGKLPGGVALAHTGLIDGIPTQRSLLKGVPYEVSENITSTFVVRITDAENLLADRTFSLTVAGPDSPIWSTAAGKLLDVHDGQEITTTLAATDSDLDVLTYSKHSGSLPPGLSFDTATAIISGTLTVEQAALYTFTVMNSVIATSQEYSMNCAEGADTVVVFDVNDYTTPGVITASNIITTGAWTEVLSVSGMSYAYNASKGENIIVESSLGQVGITLPGAPVLGDTVRIIDGSGNAGDGVTNQIDVNGNGANIMGSASALAITTGRAGITLVYYNTANGWILQEN